jgi:hypothetical protein
MARIGAFQGFAGKLKGFVFCFGKLAGAKPLRTFAGNAL